MYRLILEVKQSFEGKRANELLGNTFGFKRPVSLRPVARGVWATAFYKRDVVDQRTNETDISRAEYYFASLSACSRP
ncbi:hypothetical protein J6590_068662 [Homalodisca vitripennis]|nr:hypothetical protein J6590_068662 [Homalodisca vitripennis]